MENSKLANTLKTLDKDEFEDFGRFLGSPYHNRTDRNLPAFYDIIKPSYPDFKITKANIYKKLYGEKAYSEKSVKNIMSYTYSLLLEFLAVDSFVKNGFKKSLEMANMLRRKNLDKDFLKFTDNMKKQFVLDKAGPQSYLNNFFLKGLMIDFYNDRSMYREFLKNGVDLTQDLAALFIHHYIDYLTNKLVGTDHHNFNYKSPLMESIAEMLDLEKLIKILEENDNEYFPVLGALYYGAISYLKNSPEAFFKAKDIFIKNFDKYSLEDRYHISRNIENAVNLTEIKYDKEVTRQILDFNKFLLSHRVHKQHESEYYETGQFTDIMQAASRLRDADSIEWLVENYCDEIIPQDRECMRNIAYARIAFLRGEFEKSLSHLAKITYIVPAHKVNIKFMMLMNFYELNLPDQADAAVVALSQYNNTTNDNNEFQYKYVKDFINNYKKLWKLKFSHDKKNIEDLLLDIEKTGYLSASPWFEVKVNEIMKSGK